MRFGAGADVHQQRVDDAIAGEGIDFEAALVGRENLLALHVHVLHALVDPHDLLGERKAPGYAGARRADRPAAFVAVEYPHRLSEADDDGLLGLGHDREAAEDDEQENEPDDAQEERAAADEFRHCGRSCGCDLWTCGSGRYGVTPGVSTMVLSTFDKTCSIVS